MSSLLCPCLKFFWLCFSGVPVKVENVDDKTVKEDPLELFLYLNEIG